jgi:hypothetical protein
MKANTPRKNPLKKTRNAHLFGVGLDNKDGHKRITRSEQFSIVGGSEETHARMTETVVKTFETLKRKGETLDTVAPEKLSDIIKKSQPE